jgi:hypothetical protein
MALVVIVPDSDGRCYRIENVGARDGNNFSPTFPTAPAPFVAPNTKKRLQGSKTSESITKHR